MFLRNHVLRLAYVCTGLSVAIPAYAHSDWEEIVVQGRRVDLTGQASSASEGVVGQHELSVRPILRVGEVLETVPGLVATQHSGSGKANQYFLRGFNLDHGTDFATWYDNMPVNMRTHGHGQGYTDLSFVIPELVRTIDYKKGSYYADIGDFSAAGAAHINSFNTLTRGIFETGFGQDGYGRVLLMDSPDNDKHWLYALELQRYDGAWSDIDENVDKLNAVLKRHWHLEQGRFGITLMAYSNSWNSADQIPLRAVEQGIINERGSLDNSVGGESGRYSLSMEWERDAWQGSAYVIAYDMNLWSNFTYFLDDPVDGDQFKQVDDRRIYGGQLSYRTGETVKNIFGVEFRYDDIREVGLYKTAQRRRLGAIRSDAVEEFSIGFYWRQELPLGDRLRAILGARYDYYDFTVNTLIERNINDVELGVNSGSTDDALFSLKGGLVYALNDGWELYGSVGQGFHSNDARGTTIQADPADGGPVDTVNPLVRSFGAEIGLRAYLAESLNLSLALWRLALDSELLFVGDAGNTEAARESERDGFEATLYYHFDERWTLDIEYARTDAAFTESDPDDPLIGNYIPGALRDVVSLGLSLAQPEGWYGSLRWRYFGERPLDENNGERSGSTAVMNLRAGYRWDNLQLTLDVLNLLDSGDHDIDYFYASRLDGEPAEGIEDLHYHTMEPRTARLYLRWWF